MLASAELGYRPAMSIDETRKLKEVLLSVYGSFADKRIKNIDVGDRFIVDQRTGSDIASDGSVYGWFCSMFLEVRDASDVTLNVINIPTSPTVEGWLGRHAASFGRNGYRIDIPRGQETMLRDLANRVSAITARGNRYETPHYKYAVPRVAKALQTLERALGQGW